MENVAVWSGFAIILLYLPMLYRIHRRLAKLEERLDRVERYKK